MSTLSDVQALYGSIRGNWAKNQAHVISHILFFVVVFVICRASIPAIQPPNIAAKQISENEWFKLAKETGVIYVSFVIPFLVIGVYLGVIRVVGRILATTLMLLFPPEQGYRFRLISPRSLEPLALATRQPEFTLNDLVAKSGELALKYQTGEVPQWKEFQRTLEKLTNNAQVYLGDLCTLLLFWWVLFRMGYRLAWVWANTTRFWPVTLITILLIWLFWFRFSRAVAAAPALLLAFVTAIIPTDPDLTPLMQVSEEVRQATRTRLEKLMQEEQKIAARKPSMLHFMQHQLGIPTADHPLHRQKRRGYPFRDLYERGSRFAFAETGSRNWEADYPAYVYYRLHERLVVLGRAVKQILRYLVTGTP